MARSTFTPTVMYRDPRAAIEWLRTAFAFEIGLLLTDGDGNVAHAEMSFGDGSVGVAGEWSGPQLGSAQMKSPASLDGCCTQFLWLDVDDVNAHAAQAEAAGAHITQRPEDQFYGDRTYRAMDPDGHVWCFRQKIADVSTDDMEKATGLKFEVVS